MWHPILAKQECNKYINNAIIELNKALYQQELLCFDSGNEKISQIKLAIDILKENKNDLL